jgi:hypothetical protein
VLWPLRIEVGFVPTEEAGDEDPALRVGRHRPHVVAHRDRQPNAGGATAAEAGVEVPRGAQAGDP